VEQKSEKEEFMFHLNFTSAREGFLNTHFGCQRWLLIEYRVLLQHIYLNIGLF